METRYELKNFIEHHGFKQTLEALVEWMYDNVNDTKIHLLESLIADCHDIISKL